MSENLRRVKWSLKSFVKDENKYLKAMENLIYLEEDKLEQLLEVYRRELRLTEL